MIPRSGRAAAFVIAVMAMTLFGIASAQAAGTPAPGSVADEAVSFTVANVNQSAVPCSSDGATYTVAGHLVTPVLSGGRLPAAVTLYLHGLGFGEFFWNFSAVPGYGYAQKMAALGHASVVIDRLGYGASGHPDGNQSCLGSQATIAHQIVGDLRRGSYQLNGASPGAAFQHVALAGHSAGGAIAEIEASSFGDVDGLIVMAYADAGSTMRAGHEFALAGADCAQGAGYAPFGQTAADFDADMFFSADPRVIAAATPLRNPDPCGDDSSFPQAIAHDLIGLGDVTVPVLLVYGADDALFQPPGTTSQHALFTGSADVSTDLLVGTGHALTLERTAPQLRQLVSDWLVTRHLTG